MPKVDETKAAKTEGFQLAIDIFSHHRDERRVKLDDEILELQDKQKKRPDKWTVQQAMRLSEITGAAKSLDSLFDDVQKTVEGIPQEVQPLNESETQEEKEDA